MLYTLHTAQKLGNSLEVQSFSVSAALKPFFNPQALPQILFSAICVTANSGRKEERLLCIKSER